MNFNFIESDDNSINITNLESLTKDELIQCVKSLKRHNVQLRNVIAKSQEKPKNNHRNQQKSFDFTKCEFRHILLKFYYLGWDYQGFVVQEDTTNTVEYHIFEALQKTCLIKDRVSSNYHRCGRTDKGVSSFAQVISLDLRSKSTNPDMEYDYCKMLNRVLPDNIQFVAWCYVDSNFSARFDCQSRTYEYFFPKGNLNVDKMKIAAQYLVGTHDFRNFCKMDVNNGVTNFMRNISFVDIQKTSESKDDEFSIYFFIVKGSAFLWHQIRCIMTVLFLVGQEKEAPEVVLELLDVERNPRKPDYNIASEIPLILYDTDFEGVEWNYSKEGVGIAIRKLREAWTSTAIKSTMIKNMVTDISLKAPQIDEQCLSDFLIKGVKTKTYTSLMKRQLCDTLEDKIQNASKRSKIKFDNDL